MSEKEWGRACCTSHATFAARRVIACAKPRSWEDTAAERESQWAFDKWPLCQSLFVNTEDFDQSSEGWKGASVPALPSSCALHKVHMISPRCIDSQSVEGFLLRELCSTIEILSIHAPTIAHFPVFEDLRILVLHIGNDSTTHINRNTQTLSAIASLQSLRTLYVEADSVEVSVPNDLRHCAHLLRMGIKGVLFTESLQLPEKCSLTMEKYAGNLRFSSRQVIPSVEALLIRSSARNLRAESLNTRGANMFIPMKLANLVELRIVLEDTIFSGVSGAAGQHRTLRLRIDCMTTPNLEELNVDVPCGLHMHFTRGTELMALAAVARGPIEITAEGEWLESSLLSIFLQSKANFSEELRKFLMYLSMGARCSELELIEGDGVWEARCPGNYSPFSQGDMFALRHCLCGACFPCLSRQGLSVPCEQAWRPAGFERLLAPLCK